MHEKLIAFFLGRSSKLDENDTKQLVELLAEELDVDPEYKTLLSHEISTNGKESFAEELHKLLDEVDDSSQDVLLYEDRLKVGIEPLKKKCATKRRYGNLITDEMLETALEDSVKKRKTDLGAQACQVDKKSKYCSKHTIFTLGNIEGSGQDNKVDSMNESIDKNNVHKNNFEKNEDVFSVNFTSENTTLTENILSNNLSIENSDKNLLQNGSSIFFGITENNSKETLSSDFHFDLGELEFNNNEGPGFDFDSLF